MKITLTESNIKEMVYKAVKNILMESNYMGEMPYEEKDEKSEESETNDDDREGVSDMSQETNSETERRNQVEDFFENPGVNNAPYAYELYGVEAEKGKDTNDMKNARSQFEKDLHHKKNQSGYPYSFTSSEVNRLQSMISSNGVNEAVQKAIDKILK